MFKTTKNGVEKIKLCHCYCLCPNFLVGKTKVEIQQIQVKFPVTVL